MPSYKVYLQDQPEPVTVSADDIELDGGDTSNAWFNFYKDDPEDDDNSITVAAFPFHRVKYIV